jgi:hypothetical protein
LHDWSIVGEGHGGIERLQRDSEGSEARVVARGKTVAAPGVTNRDGGGDAIVLVDPVLGDGVLEEVSGHDVAGVLGLREMKKEPEKVSFGDEQKRQRGAKTTAKNRLTEIPRTWPGELGELMMEPVRDMLGVAEGETAALRSEKTPTSSLQAVILGEARSLVEEDGELSWDDIELRLSKEGRLRCERRRGANLRKPRVEEEEGEEGVEMLRPWGSVAGKTGAEIEVERAAEAPWVGAGLRGLGRVAWSLKSASDPKKTQKDNAKDAQSEAVAAALAWRVADRLYGGGRGGHLERWRSRNEGRGETRREML